MTVLRERARLAWDQIRRAPVAIGYLGLLWIIGLSTRSVLHGPSSRLLSHVGVGLPSLAKGYWWTPLTAGLWASSLASYLIKSALVLLLVAAGERRMGVARTFLTLAVSQVAGSLLALGLIKAAGLVQEPWLSQLTSEVAVGPLTGAIGVGFALSCTLPALWRRRLRLVLTAAIAISALYIGHIPEVVACTAAVAGLALGVLMYGRARPGPARARASGGGRPRASHHEIRVLVGILVAVSALGGLLTALIANPVGPMQPFSFLFAYPAPDPGDLAKTCADASQAVLCRELREELLYTQWPGLVVQIAPALLLLLTADGLRRGRRLAWWIALVLNTAVLGVSVWGIYLGYYGGGFTGLADRIQYLVFGAEALILPLVTVVVLLITRRRFDQSAGRGAVRRLTATSVTALGVSCAGFVVLGHLLRGHFTADGARPGYGALLKDLPGRFLPGKVFSVYFLPADLTGRLLYVWVFLVFWLVLLGALGAFFWHTSTYRESGAAERARALLLRGGSSLSYMTTWPGNQYWFTADGQVAIAYRAIAGVAVTVGGPYGGPYEDQDARAPASAAAIGEFARFCEHRGWTPCLYSVPEQSRAAAGQLGWSSVQVAEETLIPLDGLEFKGRKWQDVRTALNKAAKAGITAEWWSYQKAPLEITDQIHEISEAWVADKGLPEMGFTLGGLDELDDPNVRCLVAIDQNRKVHGVTSWLPVYATGQPVSWTLDFMRRNTEPGTFRGVMEFLIASAMLTFQQEGAHVASLSGAPLARMDRGEQPGGLQRLLDVVATAMEPVYGFRSLLNFKAKFQPTYRPLYMAYPDPAALGSIATAIGRAYLPHMTSGQAFRLLRKLH